MAKDDYDVIVFKVLIYLYACMKRKIVFDGLTFSKTIHREQLSEEYLADVLRMMQQEGLVDGVTVIRAWGGIYILASDLADMHITACGIHYLKDNGKMQEVKKILMQAPDLICSLIKLTT